VPAQVDDYPEVLLGDPAHGGVQLGAAVALERAEDVPGEALAVHPHEDVVLPLHGTLDEGDVLVAVEQVLVGVGGEVAPWRGDAGLGDPAHELLALAAVADEVGDGDHHQAVLLGEALELGPAGHLHAVLGDDLAQHARRVEAGQAGQVDGGLGVAGPLQDTAVLGPQDVDVAGPVEVGGLGAGLDQRPDGRRPVGGRDPRAGAVAVVDGDGERRPLRLGVGRDHEGEVELVGPVLGDGGADEARRVFDEEGDLRRRGELGRHDEVALVLPVLVVDDDDDLPAADGGDGLLDGGEGHPVSSVRKGGARRTWRPRRPPD
jgi:hypothetical protein